MIAEEALFSSAHAALTFAFNFSGQQYDKSAMARLAAPPSGSGRGLGGLDGAGQSGMIRKELQEIGQLGEAVLIARIAPKTIPCYCTRPCCAGKTPNAEYENAILYLVRVAMEHLSGHLSHYQLRRAIIEKHFGRKVNVTDVAEECGVSRTTASAHHTKLSAWLRGDKWQPRDGTGLEQMAWDALTDRLRAAEMIV